MQNTTEKQQQQQERHTHKIYIENRGGCQKKGRKKKEVTDTSQIVYSLCVELNAARGLQENCSAKKQKAKRKSYAPARGLRNDEM